MRTSIRVVLIVTMAAALVGCSFGKLLLDVEDGKLGRVAQPYSGGAGE